MKFSDELMNRSRLGINPGLDTILAAAEVLGKPQLALGKVIHVAGTNGKGAVCAILDAVLKGARYTSPHLVKINERFSLNGRPVADEQLELAAAALSKLPQKLAQALTYFETLTLTAFQLFADAKPEWTILETGLGGRWDATNICQPTLTIITRIGLDHCQWLGNTIEAIAAEKAGIIKPGVPIVLGKNELVVREIIEARARELSAPFIYAPDLISEAELPRDFSLTGSFNRENLVTALAALKTLKLKVNSLPSVVWPARFQRVGNFIVDGAHNPPAAVALARALHEEGVADHSLNLIFGACADKAVDEVLALLAPFVKEGFAVATNNPRSLSAAATAEKMRALNLRAIACPSLQAALEAASSGLICGSLFLAGEALVALKSYPWGDIRFDPSEGGGLRIAQNMI